MPFFGEGWGGGGGGAAMCERRGSLMVSVLVCGSSILGSTAYGVIALCSWTGHFTLSVLLFTLQ